MPGNNKNPRHEAIRMLSVISQLAFTMMACIFIGVMFGRFLDNTIGTSPLFLLLFSLFGMGAAFKAIFDMAKK